VASHWTLQRDDSGRPVGWLQINNDVTQERRKEQELRESEEGFRLLVDGVKDYAIFRLDPLGQVVSWSPARTVSRDITKRRSSENIFLKILRPASPPQH